MFTDIFGNKRFKINLHMHTTLSDGDKTPLEAAKLYKDAGYDAIAITDHWVFGEERELEGLKIFSGAEYDFGADTVGDRIYHITALFCKRDPMVERTDTVEAGIAKIIAAEGIPVLAHPAWSLNMPHEAVELDGIEFTEIYNTISGVNNSFRPYSGMFVDLAACLRKPMLLIAADDTHYYTTDGPVASVMVKADSLDRDAIVSALRSGDFYSTTGPEVHAWLEDGETAVRCSDAVKVEVHTNSPYIRGRRKDGEGITEHRAPLSKIDRYVRVEVTDAQGRVGFTNFLVRNIGK